MSESEFDAYLSLLGKLLHLSARQRMQIADELRDHLEERFQSLLDQGTPRDEALRLAVEDLGDAAALAQQFTLPHHIRRRRQLMRYSLGSAVVIATTFVMAAFFWPAHRQEPGVLLEAQAPATKAPIAVDRSSGQPKTRSSIAIRDDLMAKLESRDFELKWNEVPFADALEFLSDVSGVDLLIDQRHMQDLGLDPSTSVTLKVRQGALSVRSALELILEQIGGQDLACAVRDGVILISSADNSYENRVYNCRDLLDGVQVHQAHAGFGGVTGMPTYQIAPETVGGMLSQSAAAQIGGGGEGMMGSMGGMTGGMGGGLGGGGYSQPATTSPAGLTLIHVIQAATAPASWVSLEGQGGTISEYDGMLIIRHQPRVHQKIEELLTQLRTVRGENQPGPRSPVYVPAPGTPSPAATGVPTYQLEGEGTPTNPYRTLPPAPVPSGLPGAASPSSKPQTR